MSEKTNDLPKWACPPVPDNFGYTLPNMSAENAARLENTVVQTNLLEIVRVCMLVAMPLARMSPIQAIKIMRDLTSMGLKEAKDLIDLVRGGPMDAVPRPEYERVLDARASLQRQTEILGEDNNRLREQLEDYSRSLNAANDARDADANRASGAIDGLMAALDYLRNRRTH